MANSIFAGLCQSFKQNISGIIIDGCSLDKYVSEKACNPQYVNLWSAWLSLNNEREQAYIWSLINGKRDCILPVLLCPDDMDLSCIVIVAEVRHSGENVSWLRIGTLMHENYSIEQWRRSGIQKLETWSDEDWKKYGDYLATLDKYDVKWDHWCSEHWPDEEARRLKNYLEPFVNDERNINWFCNEKLVFDAKEYEACVEGFRRIL